MDAASRRNAPGLTRRQQAVTTAAGSRALPRTNVNTAPDNTFEFGLKTILDGLQAQLSPARQATSTRTYEPEQA
jgi:hypothetical protein